MLALLCLGSGAWSLSDAVAFEFRTTSAAARQAVEIAPDTNTGPFPVSFRFGNSVSELKQRSDTVLARRWAMTRTRVQQETGWLRSCEKGACRDPRAQAWQKLVAQVKSVPPRQQPAFVQKLVFRSVRYVPDRPTDDHWANPLSTLLQGAGDCEDHVLLKRALLAAAGYPVADMQLLILETASGAGHMALGVKAGTLLVLDNRHRYPETPLSLRGDRIAAIAMDAGYFQVR